MIIGGRLQGKTELALGYMSGMFENGNFADSYDSCIIDGRKECTEDIFERFDASQEAHDCVCMLHLEDVFRNEQYSDEILNKLLNMKHYIVTADEIGLGIVPMDREDREYRDRYGAITRKIAGDADCVIRVIAGIETVIKGEMNG